MNHRLLLPLATTLVLAALPGQRNPIDAVLIVRCGTGDLVLNKPLLDALLAEQSCMDSLRAVFGDKLGPQVEIVADLPAPHLPGTFQIHLSGFLSIQGEWTRERRDAAVDAIVTGLRGRLDHLLVEEPQRLLEARRKRLDQRVTELAGQLAGLRAKSAAASQDATSIERQIDALEQTLLTARIDLATEEGSGSRLEQLREEFGARRTALQTEVDKRRGEGNSLQDRVAALAAKVDGMAANLNPARAADLEVARAELAQVVEQREQIRQGLERLQAEIGDAQRMLTVVYEQTPMSAVATQRARARLKSLAAEREALEERRQKSAAAQREATADEVATEQVRTDIAVTRNLLTEVQGRLQQLQPVEIEVLRPR